MSRQSPIASCRFRPRFPNASTVNPSFPQLLHRASSPVRYRIGGMSGMVSGNASVDVLSASRAFAAGRGDANRSPEMRDGNCRPRNRALPHATNRREVRPRVRVMLQGRARPRATLGTPLGQPMTPLSPAGRRRRSAEARGCTVRRSWGVQKRAADGTRPVNLGSGGTDPGPITPPRDGVRRATGRGAGSPREPEANQDIRQMDGPRGWRGPFLFSVIVRLFAA